MLCRFTRDAALLQLVGEVLLPAASQQPHKLRWLVGKDAFALVEPETAAVLIDTMRTLISGASLAAVQEALGCAPTEVDIAGKKSCGSLTGRRGVEPSTARVGKPSQHKNATRLHWCALLCWSSMGVCKYADVP